MAKVLHGSESDDQLNVSENKTQAYGLSGNDTLISDNMSDVLLVGGFGDDNLIMTGGTGTINGGGGSDTFEFTYSSDKKLSAVIEDLEPSRDKIVVNFDGKTAPQLTSVASGKDVVWKDSDGFFSLTLKSVRQNDYFDGMASDEIWKVLELTNAEREKESLSALTLAEGLTDGASIRAKEITELGTQGKLETAKHTRPDGSDYYTVLNGKYNYPGENLEAGARGALEVTEKWIGSESHYANIVNPNFLKLGVGYNYFDADPTDQRYYWTQLFADSLKSSETVSTSKLLTASIKGNEVSKFISLTAGDNSYSNTVYGATLDARAGDDFIENDGLIVSISGGAGNDSIFNTGSFATINAGTGNDQISLASNSKENFIQYAAGDGNDTISGLNYTDVFSISGDADYTPVSVGNDIVVSLGTDAVTLKDAVTSGFQIIGTRSKFFMLTDADNTLENTFDNATIQALGGNDYVENYGASVTIDAGNGDDELTNIGDNVSITSGEGNDSIDNDGKKVTINAGAGNDKISNTGANVVAVGGDGNDNIYNSGSNVSVNAGNGNDIVTNTSLGSNVKINTGNGDDEISNYGTKVTINSGDGNNYIQNEGTTVTINGGANNDVVHNVGEKVVIRVGNGNDSVANFKSNVTIDGGAYNDRISNLDGSNVSIAGGIGNDTISNSSLGSNITIEGGAGEDLIVNNGMNVTINGGTEKDLISLGSYAENNLIVYNAGDGNDVIAGLNSTSTLRIGDGTGTYSSETLGDNVIVHVDTALITLRGVANSFFNIEGINSGGTSTTAPDKYITLPSSEELYKNTVESATLTAVEGKAYISNYADNVKIDGSAGNDTLANRNNKVVIKGNGGNDTLSNQGTRVVAEGGTGKDYIENIGPGAILLGDEDDDEIVNWSNNVKISGGEGYAQDILVGGGGTDTFLSGKSHGADLIRNASSADVVYLKDASLSDITATSENNGMISVSFNTGNVLNVQSTESVSARFNLTDGSAYRYNHTTKAWETLQQAPPTAKQSTYTGDNQIISASRFGNKIVLDTNFGDMNYDGGSNFVVNAPTGALVVRNALDKVIDLSNVKGTPITKAYAASTPGVIDGRGLAGREIINGSAGADVICAGAGGSQLWGGADNAADVLIGGDGADVFIGGKNQGADLILNASVEDVVNFNDATIGDITSATESGGKISISFNTGNTVNVQSSLFLSAKFILADGASYRYSHATKSWRTD